MVGSQLLVGPSYGGNKFNMYRQVLVGTASRMTVQTLGRTGTGMYRS
jgi:hypothetical protein